MERDALDVLVLGSGVAGLSAVVRLATPTGLQVGCPHQGRPGAVDHTVGPGGDRRRGGR